MKYKTIVIDPPWKLALFSPKTLKHDFGWLGQTLPYAIMTDEEIANFDVQQFADTECDLFLWTTKSKLHPALHILEKWGFKYTNFMAWNKRDGLNNNGFHNILEFVLYGYKGKSGLDYTNPIDTYFEAKRLKHSQKPDKFYSMIAKVTKEPRIDIFARKRHFGFDAYGDQVEKQMQVPLALLLEKNNAVNRQ